MLAAEIQKYDLQEESILQDPVNVKLLEALTRFADLLTIYGYNVRICSKGSLLKLSETPNKKKYQMTAYFEQWSNWIDPGPSREPIEDIELKCLKKALHHYGLKASDDFLRTIAKDQIVEVYGDEMIQLYRSLSFFQITGYSLLDIIVHEFYHLWERSTKAIESTIADCNAVLDGNLPLKAFTISRQIIRETNQGGVVQEPFVNRAILANFINIGSLVSVNDDMIHGVARGVICTSTAEIIAMGDDAVNIQFI
ncbi:hypothetical protein [Pseudobdellovibrio sp. HCB154]|uniref:hypothetical protein n=1 Tax=Pseudobdellovibrio sp. HCB154 TaxID=3386277 RepID=UPI0039172C1B